MDQLQCTRCHAIKPLTAFRIRPSKSRGLRPNSKPPGPLQPCKACCVIQTNESIARRKAADPEGFKAQRRKFSTAYAVRHPARRKKTALTHYYSHKEHYLLLSKIRNQGSLAKKKHLIAQSRHQAIKRHLPAAFTIADYDFMMQYWHFSCAVCERENGFQWIIAIDHWIPLKQPECPGTVATNMIPLCHGAGSCNTLKSNKLPFQWLTDRYGNRKATKIAATIADYFTKVQERHATTS
jgi:hypothetical protein